MKKNKKKTKSHKAKQKAKRERAQKLHGSKCENSQKTSDTKRAQKLHDQNSRKSRDSLRAQATSSPKSNNPHRTHTNTRRTRATSHSKRPRRLLIVDGYNVLRSGARYQNIMAPSPDYMDDYYNRAREMLINDVASFAGSEYRATVVFDAADNEFSTGAQETIGGVRVVFSPAGRSADEIIEKLAHDARSHDIEVLVVSSDASIQETVFAGRVTRMSANDFSYNMNSYSADSENVACVMRKAQTLGIQCNSTDYAGGNAKGTAGAGKKTSNVMTRLSSNSARASYVANSPVAHTSYIANPATANVSPKNTIAERISTEQLQKLKRLRDKEL